MKESLRILVAVIVCVLLATAVFSGETGNKDTRDAFFSQIAEPLDKDNFDVHLGEVSRKAVQKSKTELFRVEDYAIRELEEGSLRQIFDEYNHQGKGIETFETGFVKGIVMSSSRKGIEHNLLLSVETKTKDPIKTKKQLFNRWFPTHYMKRTAISFARENISLAKTLSAALSKQGYISYLYINNQGEIPRDSAEEVGMYFMGAGHRIVIDTSSARKSKGVQIEASAIRQLLHGRGSGDSDERRIERIIAIGDLILGRSGYEAKHSGDYFNQVPPNLGDQPYSIRMFYMEKERYYRLQDSFEAIKRAFKENKIHYYLSSWNNDKIKELKNEIGSRETFERYISVIRKRKDAFLAVAERSESIRRHLASPAISRALNELKSKSGAKLNKKSKGMLELKYGEPFYKSLIELKKRRKK